MNSIKSAMTPRLTIRKAAAAVGTGAQQQQQQQAQPAAPISNAALTAAVATSHAGIATVKSPTLKLSPAAVPRKCGLPRASPVPVTAEPKRRSVSPDPTLDYAGRSKVLSRTPRVPADATLNFLANFDIRYLLPGVGAGAGGENERTMSFALLHDKIAEIFLIQMRVTGTFLTVHDPEIFTVRDLMHTFFRNKPITLCNMPAENLDLNIATLATTPRALNWSLRAY